LFTKLSQCGLSGPFSTFHNISLKLTKFSLSKHGLCALVIHLIEPIPLVHYLKLFFA
jgi:hypothetical protein